MSQERIRVILVDDIADLRRNMEKLLRLESDIEVVGSVGSGEEGIELAKRIRPDVVIMDINMPGIDGISAAEILTRDLPGIQIIMMSVQGEADYMRRSMLAGAREFLIKPATTEEIVTSIRRVHKLSSAHRPPVAAPAAQSVAVAAPQAAAPAARVEKKVQRQGEVIAVFGAKGGVGTSSVVSNLAISLREQEPDKQVAVVDGNTEFGDLNVLLNLSAERTIIDLISVEDLDPQYVQDVFIAHASGIKVIPGSPPTEAELVTGEQVRRVITALREQFDYIVFDTRLTFSEPILTILDNANTIVLVATADIPSIRNTRLFFEVADRLGYEKSKIKLLLNKYEPQGTVSAQAIQSSVKHRIAVELPRDDRLASGAIQQGLPVVLSQPKSALALGYGKLARTISGVEAAQPQPERGNQGTEAPVKQKKPSFFARFFGR